MAHFAEVKNGIVKRVIVISNDDAPDPAPENSEVLGREFIRNVLGMDGEWVQTSYNRSFRVRFAGIGHHWDEEGQAFYSPKPYPSWILDKQSWIWNPPIPYPDDYYDNYYEWDEENQAWVLIEEIEENGQD
jgi:hypothetical protein